MSPYSSNYYPYYYGRFPSRKSRFGAGFVQGIASALERRNQKIEQKRMEELAKEQRRFQLFMSQLGAVQRNPLEFAPSIVPQLMGQAPQFGIPPNLLAIPDVARLGYQQAQQRGLQQRELKRKTKLEERGIAAREKTAEASMVRAKKPELAEKPVFGEKDFDKDYQRNRKSVLVEMEKAKAGPFGIVQPGRVEPITPEEEEIIHQETMRRTVDEWNRLGKPVPKRFLALTAKDLGSFIFR